MKKKIIRGLLGAACIGLAIGMGACAFGSGEEEDSRARRGERTQREERRDRDREENPSGTEPEEKTEPEGKTETGEGQETAQASYSPLRSVEYLSYYDWDLYQDVIYDSEVEYIIPDEVMRSRYPKLAAVLDEEKADLLSNYETMREEGVEYALYDLDNLGDSFWSYYRNRECSVHRADDQVLSVLSVCSAYIGGAHGDYYFTHANYEPQTGRVLKLDDIITDNAAFRDMVAEKLTEVYDVDIFFGEPAQLLADYSIHEEDGYYYTWTVEYDGISVYFSPYEIAPFASGFQCVKLTFDDLDGMIVPGWGRTTDTFVTYLIPYAPTRLDLNGDGQSVEIRVDDGSKTEWGMTEGYTVNVGDTSYENDENYHYDRLRAFVAAVGTDTALLFVESTVENDYCYYDLYAITEDSIKYVESPDLFTPYIYNEGRDDGGRLCQQDPENLVFYRRTDMFGTTRLRVICHATADGRLAQESGFYEYVDYAAKEEFVSGQDIKATIVDEEGNTVDTDVTIPAGTTFRRWRTDNVKYVDCILDDGRIARLEMDHSDWPYRINGVPEDEVFPNIAYAG